MSQSLESPSIECYISLVAEAFGYSLPTQQAAERLFPKYWRKHFDPERAGLWKEILTNAQQSQLLIKAVQSSLINFSPRQKQFLEARFGLKDGQFMTQADTIKAGIVGTSEVSLLERLALNNFGNRRGLFRQFLP